MHPGGRFHLRELKRRTRLSSASLQHEVRRLARIGALRREGARAVFSADESHPAWRAWMLLLRSGAAPADVLREALVDAEGIDGALVFGSWARGDAHPDSDVDVFLIGGDDARLRAGRCLPEAELLVAREPDVVGYGPEQLAEHLRSGNAFVQGVPAGPVQWVRGGPEAFHLAEAA